MSTSSLRFVSICLLLLIAAAPTARAQLGVAAGLNFDRLGDISTQSGASTFDNATGYHVGVFYDLRLAVVSVRPGIFLRKAGDVEWDLGGVTDKFDLTLIEIPVDVHIPVLRAPLVTPYILAGPVVSFPRSGDDDVQETFEDFLLSGSVGLGVAVRVPAIGLRLYPEVRYAFGLSRFMKDSFSVGNVEFDVEDPAKLSAVMVRIGVGL